MSLTSTAQADPASTSAYVGVGADVTQDLYAALSGASPSPTNGATSGSFDTTQFYTPLHSSDATGDLTIASFDANPAGGTTVNPGCITTKTGGPSFDRPNSTTAGLLALDDVVEGKLFNNTSASCTGTGVSVTGEIDFARAARGPATGSKALPGTDLTFIPFARDALGFLLYDPTGALSATPLTTAELTTLYSSSSGHITVGSTQVNACLTISGSTPRSNLETVLGDSDTQASAAATAADCNNIQQNSGDSFYSQALAALAVPHTTEVGDFVIPISSGSWISQANGLAVDRSSTARSNHVDLASITDATAGALGKPYTGTAPSETPNTTYYQSLYGYNVYTVLPTSSVTGSFSDPGLVSLFVGTSSSLCQSSEQALINKFGFDSLVAAEGTCGSTTTQADG
jgi:hypothetical protein